MHVGALEDDVRSGNAVLGVAVEGQVGRQPGERQGGVGGDVGDALLQPVRGIGADHVLQGGDRAGLTGDRRLVGGELGAQRGDALTLRGDRRGLASHCGLQPGDGAGLRRTFALQRLDRALQRLDRGGLALLCLLQGGQALGQALEGGRRGRGRCRDEQRHTDGDDEKNDELAHGTPSDPDTVGGPAAMGRRRPQDEPSIGLLVGD